MAGTLGQAAIRLLLVTVCASLVVQTQAIRTRSAAWRTAGRWLMAGAFVVAATAAGCLLKLLLLEDNHYLYVAEYTGPGLAWIYRVAALWGGNAGSLLFWVLILTLYGAMVSWSRHDDSERMLPWVAWILSALTLFYAVILNVAVAPFARSAEPIPMSGLNPLLQNPGMTIHPVNLYLGFIGFSIPFAYSISSLILGKTDATWLVVTRRWTLASWLFLSIGILYGAHWSYEELGWGGYWAWDPVENAALLPWLTATAFLHSAIVQERRHMLTRWNHVLVILTFWLTVLGTYLTRSGVIWSIHAFTNSALGAYFLALLMAVGAASCAILIWRWRVLRGGPPMTAVVSRESAFVFNNVLLVGCTAGVLLGTIFPLLTGWLDGAEKVVDNGYYNGVILPLAVCVLILMGMGPLLPWRHTTWRLARRAVGYPLAAAVVIGLALALVLYMPAGRLPVLGTSALVAAVFVVASVLLEYAQIGRLVKGASARVTTGGALRWMRTERRRLGGYLVHLAVALMAMGIAASGAFHVSEQKQLAAGDPPVRVAGFSLRFIGMTVDNVGDDRRMSANLVVEQGGKTLGLIQPAAVFYANGQSPTTEVALYSRPFADLYVVMLGTLNGDEAVFDIHVNPLVQFIWMGGYLFMAGTLVSLWPERRHRAAELPAWHPVLRIRKQQEDARSDHQAGKLGNAAYQALQSELRYQLVDAEAVQVEVRERMARELSRWFGPVEADRLLGLLEYGSE